MATKTYIIAFFLIILSISLYAKTDEQQLKEWTIENEKKLLEENPIVKSDWFEKECLKLAKIMQLDAINTCQLFQSEHINAYVFDNGHVYFSTAMLQLINNEHQLASILAHEYAHIEFQHYIKTLKKIKKPGIFFPKKRINKLLKKHEKEADKWSESRLKKFGFNPQQINYFLQRVRILTPKKSSNHHLKLSKRIKTTVGLEIKNQKMIEKINVL
jgi:hypothetical protein